jgi:cell division septal protein FtsQ
VTIKNFLLKIIIIIPLHLPICLRHHVIRRRHRPFHLLKIDKIVKKILKKKCQMIFLLLVVVVVVVQIKLIFLKELNTFNFIANNKLISNKVIFLLNKKNKILKCELNNI